MRYFKVNKVEKNIKFNKYKKIYIIGPVASGKTTFASNLSKKYNINHYELDKFVWNDNNKVKRTSNEILGLFKNIMAKKEWIIEDVGRNIFKQGKESAEIIFYIDLPSCKIYFRVIKRWLKQKLKLEKYNYKPTIKSLIDMFNWAHKDICNKDKKLKELSKYGDKVVIFNAKDIKLYKKHRANIIL